MKKTNNKKQQKVVSNRLAYLKKRVEVICECGAKQPRKDRAKYGTCRCDSYSLCYTLAIVIANSLYQYIADAKDMILREDWEIIEQHADAIMEWANANSIDIVSEDVTERFEYLEKERKWREAMHWLTEGWEGLWW